MKKTVLYNGNILPLTHEEATAHWMLIVDGIIKDIGSYQGYKKYIDSSDNCVNLEGKTVLPGFIDSHVFLMQTGINSANVDLSQAESLDDVYNLISERARITPRGDFIRAIKFDELKLKGKRLPTRYELDRISDVHPIWVNRSDMHTSVINSYALNKIRIPHNLSGLSRDTGVVRASANAQVRKYVYNNITDLERQKALVVAANKALENGITTLIAVDGAYNFGNLEYTFLNEYRKFLPLDVVQFFNGTNVTESDYKHLTRTGSFFLDGTFGSRTAALYQPYQDDQSNYGALNFTEKNLARLIKQMHLQDLQVAIQAIGDRAIDVALDIYEQLLKDHPKYDHRHRIEYFEQPSPRAIKRAADMGLVAMMVPAAIDYWSQEDGMYHLRIGRERTLTNNSLRTITDSGIVIASGSGSDVTEMNPFIGIHATVNAKDENKRLSLYEAMRLTTYNGAHGIFEDHAKGSLEIGKDADLIVINQDIKTLNPQELSHTKVLLTMKKGDIVYERK